MGSSDGRDPTDLSAEAIAQLCSDDVRTFNFYQLVELLCRLTQRDQEDLASEYPMLFTSKPSLGFAVSDVSKLEQQSGQPLTLETTFLGLSGSQSPLPGFLLEQIASEGETGLRKCFLDFFNHRLVSLIHQIWRKYRYYVRFLPDATDGFSTQLFALVGLANDHLRQQAALNWCKMMPYAGLLAGRSRSTQVVSGIIAHYFDLKKVSIKEWSLRQVAIPKEQQMTLGRANSTLALDSVIGESVPDCVGKFVICISELDLPRFLDFLPSGKEHQVLITLVEFILREQMAFDLELTLMKQHVPVMSLSANNPPSLGWTSFMGSTQDEWGVLIQVRQ